MDNTKTGTLIKELRKEKGMTQSDLADLLHLTDKAVSKWERGLCAPDISLLEPLAEILDTSIIELIGGARIINDEHTAQIEANTKDVLNYSKKEIAYKTKVFKKKYLLTTSTCAAIAIIACTFALWWGGYFHIIDKSVSPNSAIEITVYSRNITHHSFSNEASITVRSSDRGNNVGTTVYPNCSYQGIWWSPDSTKYVMAVDSDKGIRLALNNLEKNTESNLNAYLSLGVEMNELAEYGLQYNNENPLPLIKYQFLQWSIDSTSILIYYSFCDVNELLHSGYFWYNCEDGKIYAPLELNFSK